jgi:hypothetical protein
MVGWVSRLSMLAIAALWASAMLLSTGCESATNSASVFIDSLDVASDQASLDIARTYEYRFAQANPDSLLTELWLAAISVETAWYPLDNLCASPIGPRFTVLLTTPDARMADYDFDPGTGSLACATMLRQYKIVQ